MAPELSGFVSYGTIRMIFGCEIFSAPWLGATLVVLARHGIMFSVVCLTDILLHHGRWAWAMVEVRAICQAECFAQLDYIQLLGLNFLN